MQVVKETRDGGEPLSGRNRERSKVVGCRT